MGDLLRLFLQLPKQYALNFVLQDVERTLTDSDVENTMNRVLEALKSELGAILR